MLQSDHRIVPAETLILASLVTLTCTAIAAGQTSPHHSLEATGWFARCQLLAWVWLQTAILVTAVVLAATAFRQLVPRFSRWLSTATLLLLPAIMIADAYMFRWAGERFLSSASWRILNEFPTRLLPYATGDLIKDALYVVVATLVGLCFLGRFSHWLARRLDKLSFSPVAKVAGLLGLFAIACIGGMPLLQPNILLGSMGADSTRHPFCILRLIPFHGVKPPSNAFHPTPVVRSDLASLRNRRQLEQRLITVDYQSSAESHPNVLIVIVESFRHELVTPQIMPNLFAHAQKGMHCRTHFSGGNATNHGMFALFNGLEAIWYQQPVTYSPLMNRLFQAAGYEIGFFAGNHDWRLFRMDGFIDPSHFEVFDCSSGDCLLSDRRSTEHAIEFLNQREDQTQTLKPRLAVLYLYATHAIYQSYVDDQIFQPAADDRLPYPYPETLREQVWNRYKNSARTVDRFLKAVMRDDCVILVTGDHGESFLDDGTIGHGIRVSQYQNMTPAIFCAPGLQPRTIDAPTSHMDLLPTLLELAGIRVTQTHVFDGVRLQHTPDSELSNRVFATRNYLSDEFGLIGPWTAGSVSPFACLASLSLAIPEFTASNPIDQAGYDASTLAGFDPRAALDQWLEQRFPPR